MTKTNIQEEQLPSYNWRALTVIQAGNFNSIPAMMVGYIMSKQYGFYAAITSTILGHIIVVLLAIPMSIKSSIDKKTSSMQTEEVLGKNGNLIAMVGLVILLIGWFSVELNITSKAICNAAQGYVSVDYNLLNKLINCLLGLFIMFTTVRGIDVVRKVIRFSIVLFLITMLIAFFREWKPGIVFDAQRNWISAKGIALVAGCATGMTFDLPTFHRFAKSKRDSIVSNLLVFLVGLPISHTLGALLYFYSQQANIASLLVNPAMPLLVRSWNMLFVVISMCALNNVNLYVCGVNSANLLPSVAFRMRTYIIGVLGIVLACLNLSDNFTILLDKTLIIISCVLSILILRAAVVKKNNIMLANFSVIGGCIVGFAGAFLFKEPLFGSSYCTSALVTAAIYLIGMWFVKTK